MEHRLLLDPLDELRVIWDLVVKLAHGSGISNSGSGRQSELRAARWQRIYAAGTGGWTPGVTQARQGAVLYPRATAACMTSRYRTLTELCPDLY